MPVSVCWKYSSDRQAAEELYQELRRASDGNPQVNDATNRESSKDMSTNPGSSVSELNTAQRERQLPSNITQGLQRLSNKASGSTNNQSLMDIAPSNTRSNNPEHSWTTAETHDQANPAASQIDSSESIQQRDGFGGSSPTELRNGQQRAVHYQYYGKRENSKKPAPSKYPTIVFKHATTSLCDQQGAKDKVMTNYVHIKKIPDKLYVYQISNFYMRQGNDGASRRRSRTARRSATNLRRSASVVPGAAVG
jgi:hypothetical protein